MTEEQSMRVTLRAILPKVYPGFLENERWLVVPHEGKANLEASYPRKMRSWQVPGDRFVVLRDNDGSNCQHLKLRLVSRVPESAPAHRIRIVCQELESWFLGDLPAMVRAYPAASRHKSYRKLVKTDPDTLTNASDLVTKMTGTATKVARAQRIAEEMDPAANRSKSFQVLVAGVRSLIDGA